MNPITPSFRATEENGPPGPFDSSYLRKIPEADREVRRDQIRPRIGRRPEATVATTGTAPTLLT